MKHRKIWYHRFLERIEEINESKDTYDIVRCTLHKKFFSRIVTGITVSIYEIDKDDRMIIKARLYYNTMISESRKYKDFHKKNTPIADTLEFIRVIKNNMIYE